MNCISTGKNSTVSIVEITNVSTSGKTFNNNVNFVSKIEKIRLHYRKLTLLIIN